jgi:hypothetical protein
MPAAPVFIAEWNSMRYYKAVLYINGILQKWDQETWCDFNDVELGLGGTHFLV